jgi:hypothetical protein
VCGSSCRSALLPVLFLPSCVSVCEEHGYVGICHVRDSRGVRYANKPRARRTLMARTRDSEAQRERGVIHSNLMNEDEMNPSIIRINHMTR